jgi:hypothetical protein
MCKKSELFEDSFVFSKESEDKKNDSIFLMSIGESFPAHVKDSSKSINIVMKEPTDKGQFIETIKYLLKTYFK